MYKYENINEFIQNELGKSGVSIKNTIKRAYEFGLQQGGEIKLAITVPEETQEAARERVVENIIDNLPEDEEDLDSEDDGIG